MNDTIAIPRILGRLDTYFEKNDYEGAEKHLLYWLDESRRVNDWRAELCVENELIGLYRKIKEETACMHAVHNVMLLIRDHNIENNVGSATTYLNCGTAHEVFGYPEQALYYFKKALKLYEEHLPADDQRRGGLYNNMATTLVTLKRFTEAYTYYAWAIAIMKSQNLWLEVAITYLNIASAKEAELGIVTAESEIDKLMDDAAVLLDTYRDNFPRGYYAFVCEKCAPVYGYYGRFAYKNTLLKRAEEIYAGT